MSIEDKVKMIIYEQLSLLTEYDGYESIPESSRIVDDLGADSLDIVEIIMTFEEEFNIEISEKDSYTIDTVRSAIDLIKNKTNSNK